MRCWTGCLTSIQTPQQTGMGSFYGRRRPPLSALPQSSAVHHIKFRPRLGFLTVLFRSDLSGPVVLECHRLESKQYHWVSDRKSRRPPPFHGTSLCERPQFKTRVQICCFGPVTPPWAARPSLAWAGHILNIYIFFFIESVQRVVATAVYYTGVNVFSIYLLLFVYRCVLFCEPLPVWKRFRFWSGRG